MRVSWWNYCLSLSSQMQGQESACGKTEGSTQGLSNLWVAFFANTKRLQQDWRQQQGFWKSGKPFSQHKKHMRQEAAIQGLLFSVIKSTKGVVLWVLFVYLPYRTYISQRQARSQITDSTFDKNTSNKSWKAQNVLSYGFALFIVNPIEKMFRRGKLAVQITDC